MNKNFEGVYIPAEIWMLELPLNDRFYLAIYNAYGKDTIKADEIMSANFSKSTILKIKNRLASKGYIEFIKTPQQAKQFVLDTINKGKTCEWCHHKCYVLHEHHFPISKANGGRETVKICPNCHAVYHAIFREEK